MEKDHLKIYIVLNTNTEVKFKCTDQSVNKYLNSGEHFTIIAEMIEMIEDPIYLHKLNEGIRLPPDPLSDSEINRITQKASKEKDQDMNRLLREISRLKEEIMYMNTDLQFLKFDKTILEEYLENSRPTYKKMLSKNAINSGSIGFVYVIRTVGDYYKIGKTTSLERRFPEIKLQLPYKEFEAILIIETNDKDELERLLHLHFQRKRTNGEWFRLTDFDINEIISGAILDKFSQNYMVVPINKRY